MTAPLKCRNLFFNLCLFYAMLSLLSACVDSTNDGSIKNIEMNDHVLVENHDSGQKLEPIELVFYHTGGDWNEDGYFMREYGESIMGKFPHITPIFLPTSTGSLNNLIVANQQLDIIVGSVGNAYSLILPAGIPSDMEDLIKQYVYCHQFETSQSIF